MTEKRTQPRFEVSLDVRWLGSGTHYNLRMADISGGGCYVDTILEVIQGETLFLKILMPDGEWFEVQGVVAHRFPQLGFGVRFINLVEEQRRQIGSLTHQENPLLQEIPEARHFNQIDVSCSEVM